MLVELLKNEGLQFLAEFVRVFVLVNGRYSCDGDTNTKLVWSGYDSERLCPMLSKCKRSRSRMKTSETAGYVLHEHRESVMHALGAGRTMVSSPLLIRGESDEDEEMWVGEVLMLSRFVLKRIKRSME